MDNNEHISVAVQDDFVERQKRAKPIPALAELIWNGLDGDASAIKDPRSSEVVEEQLLNERPLSGTTSSTGHGRHGREADSFDSLARYGR